MIAPRTIFRLALVASMTLLAGCGGTTPEVDNAEVVQPDPAAKNAPNPPAGSDTRERSTQGLILGVRKRIFAVSLSWEPGPCGIRNLDYPDHSSLISWHFHSFSATLGDAIAGREADSGRPEAERGGLPGRDEVSPGGVVFAVALDGQLVEAGREEERRRVERGRDHRGRPASGPLPSPPT